MHASAPIRSPPAFRYGKRAGDSRLRNERDGAGQDARRVQQGRARAARLPARRPRASDAEPRFGVNPPFGALLAFGEHKGYGLALLCELLGGALAAGMTQHSEDVTQKRILNGMLTVLIDPQRSRTAQHSSAKR